jgi:riboflavin synthase
MSKDRVTKIVFQTAILVIFTGNLVVLSLLFHKVEGQDVEKFKKEVELKRCRQHGISNCKELLKNGR